MLLDIDEHVVRDAQLYVSKVALQGGAGGLIHGWVDFDLDVPLFSPATQPIQPYSHLPKQN